MNYSLFLLAVLAAAICAGCAHHAATANVEHDTPAAVVPTSTPVTVNIRAESPPATTSSGPVSMQTVSQSTPQMQPMMQPPPQVPEQKITVVDEPRYRVVDREVREGDHDRDVLMKIDTQTGKTWVFYPGYRYGQVDQWEEVDNRY